MPHIVVEYTRNIEADGAIPDLVNGLCDALLRLEGGIFPPQTIRARATPLDIYRVTGDDRDGFVHIVFKVGPQLDEAIVKASRDALFSTASNHFARLLRDERFGLSLEIVILGAGGASKIDTFSTAADN